MFSCVVQLRQIEICITQFIHFVLSFLEAQILLTSNQVTDDRIVS